MSELEAYLEPYFSLEANQVHLLANFFKKETISKNDFYTESGKSCNKLSFISSGFFRIFKYTDEKDVTQWVSSQGEFITDLSSLVFDTNAQWNIQALTDCEIYTISKENYLELHNHISNWGQIEKLFLSKCFLIMEQRIFSFLSMTAEERFDQFMNLKGDLFNEIPHHFIASMLGMTPETLSRVRKKSIT